MLCFGTETERRNARRLETLKHAEGAAEGAAEKQSVSSSRLSLQR